MAPFIAIENKPSVSMFMGSVSMFIIGFTTMFITVRHAPTIAAMYQGLTCIVSGIKYAAPYTPADSNAMCNISFIYLLYPHTYFFEIGIQASYAIKLSTTFLTNAPSALPFRSRIISAITMPFLVSGVNVDFLFSTNAVISASDISVGRNSISTAS